MRLLIVRHGVAMERADFAELDSDDGLRPLTAEGVRKMRAGARGLRELARRRPDVLLTSPLERASATAAILEERAWPGLRARECAALLPTREPNDLLAELRRLANGSSESSHRAQLAPREEQLFLAQDLGWSATPPAAWRDRAARAAAGGAAARAPRKREQSPDKHNMLVVAVGHEPHLSGAISWFLAGAAAARPRALLELKKGGACLIEFPDEIAAGAACLRWLLQPKQLRALAH